MSLKKKIILSFFISALIIAILVVFEYVNFIKIRKEIRYLEITDTIRSKSLQLRRHEKNFFLRGELEEIKIVYDNLNELTAILNRNKTFDDQEKLIFFRTKIDEYEASFNHIETIVWNFQREFSELKTVHERHSQFFPLIESTFLERPLVNARLLEEVFHLGSDNPSIINLRELSEEINTLRKNGEDILISSEEFDRTARENADSFIYRSQIAILIFFPLFLIVGIGTFLFMIGNVVKRLQLLTDVVEKTAEGYFSPVAVGRQQWAGTDEVGILINKFNSMEEQLFQRETELLRSKKLAAIGTLASGVAHELNNPLNNIYTTAQRLLKKSADNCPPVIKKGLYDIYGQTMRVKHIVSELLEFARGREPQMKQVDINNLIKGVYSHLEHSSDLQRINFSHISDPADIMINADPEQIEQVFINLFTNAIEAISGDGYLTVKVTKSDKSVTIIVSDSGGGIPPDAAEKIFEPFYTTKDKGTGLGLAIVFNIIQKHGGEIGLDSKTEKGTTFTITLPVAAHN